MKLKSRSNCKKKITFQYIGVLLFVCFSDGMPSFQRLNLFFAFKVFKWKVQNELEIIVVPILPFNKVQEPPT